MDESSQESSRSGSLTLRFLAAPTDVAFLGDSAVAGGRVLKWIDKAAFANLAMKLGKTSYGHRLLDTLKS